MLDRADADVDSALICRRFLQCWAVTSIDIDSSLIEPVHRWRSPANAARLKRWLQQVERVGSTGIATNGTCAVPRLVRAWASCSICSALSHKSRLNETQLCLLIWAAIGRFVSEFLSRLGHHFPMDFGS